ncbi:MAG: hypothetical protein ACRC4M_05040 [Mycoplasma sp.]
MSWHGNEYVKISISFGTSIPFTLVTSNKLFEIFDDLFNQKAVFESLYIFLFTWSDKGFLESPLNVISFSNVSSLTLVVLWWIAWYPIMAGINHSIMPTDSTSHCFFLDIFFNALYWAPIPANASKSFTVL